LELERERIGVRERENLSWREREKVRGTEGGGESTNERERGKKQRKTKGHSCLFVLIRRTHWLLERVGMMGYLNG